MIKKFRIALAGNPNCGKTCIFNTLTGARQHVGNYPGVTVESKLGNFKLDDFEIELVDLPGVYSLSSNSPEELVAFRELTKPGIDVILNVIDATIPRRSMYLTTQLAELHIPMVLALNMSDEAAKKGLEYDFDKLSGYFGAPVVPTVGPKSDGVAELRRTLSAFLPHLAEHGVPMLKYGPDVDESIDKVARQIRQLGLTSYRHLPERFFAIKLLEQDKAVGELAEFAPVQPAVKAEIAHLSAKHAIDAETFMADCRYAMLSGACREAITTSPLKRREISDKLDYVLANKFLGLPLFLIIVYLTFYFTFTCAEPFMDWIEAGFGALGEVVKSVWPENTLLYLRDLLTDGVIGGVGGVLVFLPNILFLFLAIAILEDSGYMARAAFVMDGVMRRFGLQGRSFVPLVLGFGCNVPAVMATRSIESERDRKTTIMVLPLMSCGARLPIYALIIPVFFAVKYQALVMWLMYLIGVAVALIAARILKNTLFKGDGEVYLMELPPYRCPTWRSLLLHMWDRAKMYLHKAGTIILLTSLILYVCNTWPEKKLFSQNYDAAIEQVRSSHNLSDEQIALLANCDLIDATAAAQLATERSLPETVLAQLNSAALTAGQKAVVAVLQEANDQIAGLENARSSELMEYTVSGRVGKVLEPLFRPIGFDWKLTTASIGALAAKEVFVSQLGILYAAGQADEESVPLREQLVKNYTPLQAFCIMLFCLLSIPCLATLAVIRRELNSWPLMLADAGGLLVLAYGLTLIAYQVGAWLGVGNALLG